MMVGMACRARLGLKHFGIGTEHALDMDVGMACGARLGLKLSFAITIGKLLHRRDGLWSPFEIETDRHAIELGAVAMSGWPVEPVWD